MDYKDNIKIRNYLETEVLPSVDHFLEKTNIQVKVVNTKALFEQYADFGYEYRLTLKEFKNMIIPLVILDDQSNAVGTLCIVLYNNDAQKTTRFWVYNEEYDRIKSISLFDLVKDYDFPIITFGLYKMVMNPAVITAVMRYCVNFSKILFDHYKPFSFIETTGVTFISKQDRLNDPIYFKECDQRLAALKEVMGQTREKSKMTDVVAKAMKFKEQTHLFNYRTLGKLYFNQTIDFDTGL